MTLTSGLPHSRAAAMNEPGGNDSEWYRAECEARTAAAWATDEERADFLKLVEKHRGPEAAQALRRDIWHVMKGFDNGKA